MSNLYVLIFGGSLSDFTPAPKSQIVTVYRGVAIYRIENSRYWYVRTWDRHRRKYVVRSTKETHKIPALKFAQTVGLKLLSSQTVSEEKSAFKTFAYQLLSNEKIASDSGNRSVGSYKAMVWCIHNSDWGLLKVFGDTDVRDITTTDFREYMDFLDRENPDWAPSTKNTILATFRNVLKQARDKRIIDKVPETPRSRQVDNPRPFFRFYPVVSHDEDAYRQLIEAADLMSQSDQAGIGGKVSDELRDIIPFLVSSFVRPISSELYAIRHKDITIADNPKRLLITIRNWKTGFRVANTLSDAVGIYEQICQRHPNHSEDDHIFLPDYTNRITAMQVIQKRFRTLLKMANLQTDPVTGARHSIYSLRHTAICRRLVLSGGKVNIFTLARNAGTSVDQIERFYARNLPLSSEMVRNLQTT